MKKGIKKDMKKERCDVKVWSGSCEHASYSTLGEKYLCEACGTITRMEHEVSREGFVHIKGDDSTAS